MLGLLESEGYNCSTMGIIVASSKALVPTVIMDLVNNLPHTGCGHNAIYTVVDRLSKFKYFILCKHTVDAAELA